MFKEADFSPRQRALVQSRDRRVLVDAGAGSGKTRTLIGRIVGLLEDPACWMPSGEPELRRIVAITFTEKAALEMKTRLRGEFRERARSETIRESRVDWAALERDVENARISTIHSFCAGLLRQHALLLGINPDTRVLDATETGLLFSEFLEETLSGMLDAGDPDARALCVEFGVPGVVRLLRELMGQRVRLTHLLDDMAEWLSTPECYAAFLRNCRSAVSALIEHIARGRRFRRYERLFLDELCPLLEMDGVPEVIRKKIRCARPFFDAIRRQPETLPVVLNEYAAQWKAAGQFRSKQLEGYLDIKTLLEDLNKYIRSLAYLKETEGDPKGWLPEAARLTVALKRLFERTRDAWQAHKAERNALDFDDLILEVRNHLRDNDRFRALIRGDIRYMLVDEQQDTDPAQMEIFDLVCEGEDGPALFMVGDANQSIYRFRGAEVSVFVRQKNRPGTVNLDLLENYRCQGAVLAFINAFFARSGMLQQYGPYRKLDATRDPLPGPAVEVYVTPVTGRDRKLTAEEKAEQEAEFIAERIRRWMEPAPERQNGEGTDETGTYHPGDFAILLRQGTHAGIFEESLRRRGIPSTVHVGATFYKQQEVLDCAALAQLALNGYDEAALVRVLRGPFVGLSDDDLVRLRVAADTAGQSLAECFHSDIEPPSMDHPGQLAWARDLYRRLSGARHLDAGSFFRNLFAWTEAETLALGLPHGFEIRANLRKMQRVAESFVGGGKGSLRSFVAGLDQFVRFGADEGEANLHGGQVNAVRVLSIHKAKGLEFPVVFLPQTSVKSATTRSRLRWHPETGLVLSPEAQDFVKEAFTFQRIVQAREELDEQAEMERLLYVAMTRARDRLVLCVPEKPEKNSWSESLSEFLKLTEHQDGDLVGGEAWQARIWRSIPKTKDQPPRNTPETIPGISRGQASGITERAGSGACQVEVPVISVTRLLNLMGTRELEEDEDREETPEPESVPDEVMLSEGRRQAVRRGTLVHRFFELWRDFSAAPPDLDRLFRELRVAPSRREHLRCSLEEVARLFQKSSLRDRLARDGGARREYPFYFRLDRVAVRGTLDWLGSDGLILDYKTGHCTDEKLRRYEAQLALYAAATRQVLGMPGTEGILYFTDIGHVEVVPLDDALVDRTVARAREAVACYEASLAERIRPRQ
ncbi:MAG TPA: UvrD-helicase domain-containing protein [Candidatus Hydrogenedentes bacterium]|nr:UvrD-helicase domain-containing protein [Candidatus Hydrogenedentota bacterium]